jgi:hypothetical protein
MVINNISYGKPLCALHQIQELEQALSIGLGLEHMIYAGA